MNLEKVKTSLVIPVFNEELRLDSDFYTNLNKLEVDLIIFVDDGSTDKSKEAIDRLTVHLKNKIWHVLQQNRGKSEAIRQGFIQSLDLGISIIATADADGAISINDINSLLYQHLRIMCELDGETIVVSSAARVRMAGWSIYRSTKRQWIGRVIATCVNVITDFEIYDPQSPLKCYSAPCDTFKRNLENSFKTRWFYEMELLMRLRGDSLRHHNDLRIFERPISFFRDVPGSKLKVSHVFEVGKQLICLFNLNRDSKNN